MSLGGRVISTTIDRGYPPAVAPRQAARPLDATVTVPGSKSITNRALIAAALADGPSELVGALHSDDTRYMAAALNALGVNVESDEANAGFRVEGGGGTFTAPEADLFVGNSGTTMRFLTAALPLGRGRYRIDGVPRMRQRPIAPLLAALDDLGADARSEGGTGCPPVVVQAAGLRGGQTRMAGELSSQYFSALLLSAPYAQDGVAVEVIGDLVSKPYLPMTAAVMAAFGVTADLDTVTWRQIGVAPGQRYAGRLYSVEPDASNASYFFAAAAVTGGRVRIDGLGRDSTQGDLRFVDVLAKMGAEVEIGDEYTEVRGPAAGGTARSRSGPGADFRHRPDPRRHRAARLRSDDHSRDRSRAAEGDRPGLGPGDRATPTGAGGRRVSGRHADHAPSPPAGRRRHL